MITLVCELPLLKQAVTNEPLVVFCHASHEWKNMRVRQIGSWNPKDRGENKKYTPEV